MTMLKKFSVIALFAMIPAVLVGCSCQEKEVCYTPPPPRPRPAPVVCDPCAAPSPVAYAPIVSSAPVCTTNACQIVAPGTTVYSDPPTVTMSSGQVVGSTPVRYYTVTGGAPAYTNVTTVSTTTNTVPRSSNVRTI